MLKKQVKTLRELSCNLINNCYGIDRICIVKGTNVDNEFYQNLLIVLNNLHLNVFNVVEAQSSLDINLATSIAKKSELSDCKYSFVIMVTDNCYVNYRRIRDLSGNPV